MYIKEQFIKKNIKMVNYVFNFRAMCSVKEKAG